MTSRLDGLILLPEFDGPVGIIFKVTSGGSLSRPVRANILFITEDQYILSKGKSFSHTRFGQEIFADLFYVHDN